MGNKIYLSLDDFYNNCFKYNSIRSMTKGEGVGESTIIRYLNKLKGYDFLKREEVMNFWKVKQCENNFGIYKDRIKYDLDDKAFDVLTQISAYWLGMIASDGCIYENINKISIIAKEEDERHIEEFRKFLRYTCPLKHRDSKCMDKVFRSVYLEIHSKYMKNILINKYGIVPKKSNKDIDYFCYIPDEFKLYFLFGYFDGDGSILLNNDKNKKQNRICIIGNYSFLNSVNNFLSKRFYIKSSINKMERQGCSVKYFLEIKQVYSVYEFCRLYIMFGKSCLLDRKFKKIEECYNLLKKKVENNDNLKYHSGYYIDIRKKQDISNRIREKKRVCKNCGTLICDNAEYCVDCYNLNRRVVERPSREVLKYEIRNYPFIKLSEKYGVSDNAIRKWCKFYNLPYKSTIIKNISDKDWLNI